ncbi:MAG: T9SS type A sorting domain-containing protein [Prevotella sp.]|nr:T9SS type A sorting domain-containing protein [Prevotella sp.]
MNHARIFLLLTMLMLPLLGHAQGVAYEYDASGNRINRYRILRTRRVKGSDGAQLFSAAPNPVSDILQIKYEDEAEFSGEYQYTLLGVYGETALIGVSNSANCSANVSGLSQGIYILHIVYGEEEQSIKIIKN